MPFSALVIASSLLAGRILARLGGRLTLVSGLTLIAAGMLIYTRYTRVHEEGGIAPTVAGLAVTGAALGWASVAATSIGMASAEHSEQGLVAGILNTATQVGTAAGVAVLGGLATARTGSVAGDGKRTAGALVDGFHAGWLAAAGIAATGAVFVALLGDWPPAPRETGNLNDGDEGPRTPSMSRARIEDDLDRIVAAAEDSSVDRSPSLGR